MDKIEAEKRYDFVSKYGKLFLWVLAAFTVAFGVFLCYANNGFRLSQEEIKKSYVEHIRKADSLYFDMVAYNKDYSYQSSELNAAILTDSLLKLAIIPNGKLSESQYKNLSEIVSSHFENIQKLHARYDGKLLHDSLLLSTERQLLERQTQTMLDLHLNKIEHEYSNITMWAAVLTILFLVFSFYSIFKMDELVQQGNEGLRDIRQLYADGKANIDTIKTDGNKMLGDYKLKLDDTVNSQQRIISETVEQTQKELNNKKEQLDKTIQNVVSEFGNIDKMRRDNADALSNTLATIEKRYDNVMKEKVKQLDLYLERVKQFMDESMSTQEKK